MTTDKVPEQQLTESQRACLAYIDKYKADNNGQIPTRPDFWDAGVKWCERHKPDSKLAAGRQDVRFNLSGQ